MLWRHLLRSGVMVAGVIAAGFLLLFLLLWPLVWSSNGHQAEESRSLRVQGVAKD